MRRFDDDQFAIWYFEAVRSVLILDRDLLPEEADKVLAVTRLGQHIRHLLEAQPGKRFNEDPRDVADACMINAISQL